MSIRVVDLDLISHLIATSQDIVEFTLDLDKTLFCSDRKTVAAACYSLIVIWEASA